MASKQKFIAVIGSGVIGLQTAISLLQKGYRVAVIAKHFPGDKSIEYTSPWAGAHWRSHAAESDLEQQQWDIETYNHWLQIIKGEQQGAGLSGLGLRKSRYYSSGSKEPWYSGKVLSFEPIPASALGEGINHGHVYTSIMVNVPMYLDYLYRTAQSLGAIVIRHALPTSGSFKESLSAAAGILVSHSNESVLEISAFVNAIGISARNLVPDPNVYPVSGQTVTVCGEAKQITTVEATPSNLAFKNPIVYVLPRPHSNTTILGGTKQVASWKAEPDPEVTAEILRRAKDWCPELLNESGEFEVLSEQVGLRPARGGGVRVEVENTDGFVVCHAYGHAGAGYQNSVGSANKVVKLLGNWLQKT